MFPRQCCQIDRDGRQQNPAVWTQQNAGGNCGAGTQPKLARASVRHPSQCRDRAIEGERGKKNLQRLGEFGGGVICQKRTESREHKRNPRCPFRNHSPLEVSHEQAGAQIDQNLRQHHRFKIARPEQPEDHRQKCRIAFVLAALCPFLANYAAAELTETLEIFFTALALDCAVAALARMPDRRARKFWLGTGAAIAACILLRPDGGILLAAVAVYLAALAWKHRQRLESIRGTLATGGGVALAVVAFISLAPLVPWTIRNLHTLHHFQPLAPRYANDADELVPRGFNR